jgi:N-ethylmaleimide reductase
LPAQFLSTGTNHRCDEYGGSLDNRLRFVIEVLDAMSAVNGADKVGLRICPANPYNDLHDDNPKQTFSSLLAAISDMDLAYLHAIQSPNPDIDVIQMSKAYFKGNLILNDGFDAQGANATLLAGHAQAVSFGKAFIANPDLPERFKYNFPIAEFDPTTLYSADAEGYSSYKPYSELKTE